MTDPTFWFAERVVTWIPLVLSLSVHEWAHAWSANRLGDDTARQLGRMTVDPLAHIDPMGTFVLPLLGIPFGWAKPVPVNPVRFRGVTQGLGMMITAAAGPISNLLLAVGCAALLGMGGHIDANAFAAEAPLGRVLETAIGLNIVLAFFNLIPIPPLDGSRLVDWAMPTALEPLWRHVQSWGRFPLLVVLVAPVVVGIDVLAWPRALAEWLIAHAR